jgi:hypothetical protein
MYKTKHSIYKVGYCVYFQAYTGNFGKYYPEDKGRQSCKMGQCVSVTVMLLWILHGNVAIQQLPQVF